MFWKITRHCRYFLSIFVSKTVRLKPIWLYLLQVHEAFKELCWEISFSNYWLLFLYVVSSHIFINFTTIFIWRSCFKRSMRVFKSIHKLKLVLASTSYVVHCNKMIKLVPCYNLYMCARPADIPDIIERFKHPWRPSFSFNYEGWVMKTVLYILYWWNSWLWTYAFDGFCAFYAGTS